MQKKRQDSPSDPHHVLNRPPNQSSEWRIYLRAAGEGKQRTPENILAFQRKAIYEGLLSKTTLPIGREYCDLLTSTTVNRDDFHQMVIDARAGNFSHLALYRADRLGRDAAEGLQVAKELIDLGIKIRVASSPSLKPETVEGFFMFLIQMDIAHHEVDVLRLRTREGMKAKLLAGGWANKAPEGYVNKERAASSNRYERWVEPDPVQIQAVRLAWKLLLTGSYTLDQICLELSQQGYRRSSGLPWSWVDTVTGNLATAKVALKRLFCNPFYAGWVVSEKFGIPAGKTRGQWEPAVTADEFERGLEILASHSSGKRGG